MSKHILMGALLAVALAGGTAFEARAHEEHAERSGGDPHNHGEEEGHEGRTEITPEAARNAAMEILQAGPAKIRETALLNGDIILDPNKTARIKARFPGIVRETYKNVGDSVNAGEALATVEANDSLQTYQVNSPLGGTVIARNTNPGDVAGEAPLFVVSDLSSVWAELHVFHKDQPRIKIGDPVTIHCADNDTQAESVIGAFMPLAESISQTLLARVHLPNADGHWRAGMNVSGKAVVAERDVPLAVRNTAIQRFEGADAVFVKEDGAYEARKIEPGISDGEWTEIRHGIEAGETYVGRNSFIVKADIEKAGASHDHD